MTKLIYRGIAHTGQKTTTPRVAQNLVYRGAAHDGLAHRHPAKASLSGRAYTLRYRGYAHRVARGRAGVLDTAGAAFA